MTVPRIDLVYDRTCPHIQACRDALSQALAAVHARSAWTEWDRNADSTPVELRGFGSPTILMNGKDIDGAAPSAANACRLYRDADAGGRAVGAPPVRLIVRALLAAESM